MASSLEGALAGIPGLGGYLGAQQFNAQQDNAQLQQAVGVSRLAEALRGQSEEKQLREIVSKGGSPEAVIGALLRTGTKGAEMAHKYSQALGELGKQKILDSVAGADGGSGMQDTQENAQRLIRAGIVHPHLTDAGKSMLERVAAREQLPLMQSQQQPIGETPTLGADGVSRSVIPSGGQMVQPPGATEPIPVEVAQQAQAGAPFSTAVGDQLPTDLQAVGGRFTPFLQSANPAVRQMAAQMTQYVNSLSGRTVTPDVIKRIETRAEQMATMEAQSADKRDSQQRMIDAAQAGRQFSADNRSAEKAPTGYKFKEDGTLEPIKGGPKDISSTEVKPLEIDAMRYLSDGTMPPNMGRGVQGAAEAKSIRARADEIRQELGMTPDEVRANQAVFKSTAAALSGIQRQKALVLAYEKTALKGADIALEMSDKVDRDSGIPLLDKWIQSGRKAVAGDVDVTRLQNAVETLTNEYAKVMSGSSGGQATTVSMQQHAREMLSGAMTKDQFKGVVDLMKREMRETREPAFDAQIAEIKDQMVNSVRKPKETAPAAAPAAQQYPTARAANGRTVIFKDGKWQTPAP